MFLTFCSISDTLFFFPWLVCLGWVEVQIALRVVLPLFGLAPILSVLPSGNWASWTTEKIGRQDADGDSWAWRHSSNKLNSEYRQTALVYCPDQVSGKKYWEAEQRDGLL